MSLTLQGRLTTTRQMIKCEKQVDSGPPPGALRGATYCGVARLCGQAGRVAGDEAVLFIQPAGTLQDAAQSQTERKITPASSLMGAKVCTVESICRKRSQMGAWARPCSVPNERASVPMWREALNGHGRVMWRGQVTGHMSSLASNPGAAGQRRSVKQPFNRCFC